MTKCDAVLYREGMVGCLGGWFQLPIVSCAHWVDLQRNGSKTFWTQNILTKVNKLIICKCNEQHQTDTPTDRPNARPFSSLCYQPKSYRLLWPFHNNKNKNKGKSKNTKASLTKWKMRIVKCDAIKQSLFECLFVCPEGKRRIYNFSASWCVWTVCALKLSENELSYGHMCVRVCWLVGVFIRMSGLFDSDIILSIFPYTHLPTWVSTHMCINMINSRWQWNKSFFSESRILKQWSIQFS